jgi:hypothetical protein
MNRLFGLVAVLFLFVSPQPGLSQEDTAAITMRDHMERLSAFAKQRGIELSFPEEEAIMELEGVSGEHRYDEERFDIPLVSFQIELAAELVQDSTLRSLLYDLAASDDSQSKIAFMASREEFDLTFLTKKKRKGNDCRKECEDICYLCCRIVCDQDDCKPVCKRCCKRICEWVCD